MPRNSNIQFRRGSSSDWSTNNPVLSSGEPGFDLTNKVIKIGDGSSQWSSLDSIAPFNTSLVEGSGIDLNYDSGTDSLAIAVDFSGTFNTDLAAGVGIGLDYDSGTDVLTIGITLNQIVNGRLTLESGEPVSTTDQTAKTTLYFTPYQGNQIALYDGTAWGIHSLSELSLSLSGYTANTNYDIFIYDNSGTLTLESVAWTNNTTRATSLTTQDGVYAKSGATTRRYLGTIRTTSTTGQCEDSESSRFVWNLYNQQSRTLIKSKGLMVLESSHTYNGTYRQWDADSDAQVNFVLGLNLSAVLVILYGEASSSTSANPSYAIVGQALDRTTGYDTTVFRRIIVSTGTTANTGGGSASTFHNPGIGYHYVAIVESTASTGTSTFISAKLSGDIKC